MSSDRVPIFLTSFNCGKEVSGIFDSNSYKYENFVNNLHKILPTEIPIFFAFGFQELCSVIDGSFQNIVQEHFLKPATKILVDTLKYKYGNSMDFDIVASITSGAIGMVLISHGTRNVQWDFNNISTAKSGKGLFFSSLKGSCGIRFTVKNNYNDKSAEYTLACCHLNANEGPANWKRRNTDLIQLMKSLRFKDGFGILKPESHCFILGDLNYRAKINVLQQDNFSDKDINEELFESVDELTISRITKREIFHGFDEATIKFKPTYKFFEGSIDEYNLKRVPSWCDRILYLKYKDHVKVLRYDSVPAITLSDHKPVYLYIEVPLKAPENELIAPDGTLLTSIGSFSTGYSFLPSVFDGFIDSVVTSSSDFLIGWGLYFTTDSDGRKYFFVVVFLVGVFISLFS